jgi:putative GTP pyrophosphokinase
MGIREQKDILTANSVEKDALLPKEEFLKKYKISQTLFDDAKLNWNTLKKIREDFIQNEALYLSTANMIISKFMTQEAKDAGVHSVKYRIKNPDGLVEKIIRKTIDTFKKGGKRSITLKNYTDEITEIVGVRILHVFKYDWFNIHDFIKNHCKYPLKENPIAYIRKGDEKLFLDSCKKSGCDVKPHPKGYRSIHYVITPFPKKKICHVEIQVRTVFEDGWSEIDHKLRYNSEKTSENALDSYLLALNRIAGSADEIGTIIKNRQTELMKLEYEKASHRRERKK